ncbi:hypothetical protein OF83DRAFT_1158859 [Amylostereum chailletii]|nr:hypothetical protein OF83DRAFT_1158859 [Amylostereum chailletii]
MFSAVSSFSSALFSGLCTVFTSEAPDTPPVDTGKPPRRLHARHRPGNVNRKHRVRLCTLSLEMFLEIFENVDLVDLWALSMTSRAFRKTLLSPIMNPVWKRVFIANKAPSPPDEIPRLQWIHWLYLVKTCSTPGCARKGTHAVFWTLQKLCTTCRGEQYISQPSLPYHPMFRNIHLWVVIATVPHHIGYKPHEVQPVRYYPIAELQALSVEWNEAQHFDERTMLRWLNNKIAPVQELMTVRLCIVSGCVALTRPPAADVSRTRVGCVYAIQTAGRTRGSQAALKDEYLPSPARARLREDRH